MAKISEILAKAYKHHQAGLPQAAEQLYRQVVALAPDHAEAWHLLGVACAQLGNGRAAIESIGRAVALKPDFAEAFNNLGNVYKDQGNIEEAAACYRRAIESSPGNAAAHNNLGVVLFDQGTLTGAADCYRRAIDIDPAFATAHNNLGNALRVQGKLEEAIASFRRAIEHRPGYVNAWWMLAVLLQGRLDDEEVAAMQRLLVPPNHAQSNLAPPGLAPPNLGSDERAALEFGLAQALDARGAYDEAAQLFSAANASRQAALAKQKRLYSIDESRSLTDELIAAFVPELFGRTRGFGLATEVPVFIVGLPRSGTTLVEQILASHSRVFGAGELQLGPETFQSLPEATGRNDLPVNCIAGLDRATVDRLAQRHLARLRTLSENSLRIVDKLPENFRYLGLFAILFPQARIIHCRRNLRDVALSCWQTNFTALPWASNAEQIVAYFADYVRLMKHWRIVLPTPFLEVDYEEMVVDTETVARRILAWCHLDWEPGCLKFHETQRSVQTASAAQVRRPIYQSSVGRWKNYERHLGELFDGVGLLEDIFSSQGTR
jgi:tetratricopeptide (TPR) repeat protein